MNQTVGFWGKNKISRFRTTFNTICQCRLLLKFVIPSMLGGVDISWTTSRYVCVLSQMSLETFRLSSLNVSRAHFDSEEIVWTNFTPQFLLFFLSLARGYYNLSSCIMQNTIPSIQPTLFQYRLNKLNHHRYSLRRSSSFSGCIFFSHWTINSDYLFVYFV